MTRIIEFAYDDKCTANERFISLEIDMIFF